MSTTSCCPRCRTGLPQTIEQYPEPASTPAMPQTTATLWDTKNRTHVEFTKEAFPRRLSRWLVDGL